MHILGKVTCLADRLRIYIQMPSEWFLNPSVAQQLFSHWGQPCHTSFMFCSDTNCISYFSLSPLWVSHHGMLTYEWHPWCLYAIPPFPLISDCVMHIPGKANCLADRVNRYILMPHEWPLNPSVVQQMFSFWGQPWLTLFIFCSNTKCSSLFTLSLPQWVSYQWMLTSEWTSWCLYAFLPVLLVSEFLQKTTTCKSSVILITSLWPRQIWFPLHRPPLKKFLPSF